MIAIALALLASSPITNGVLERLCAAGVSGDAAARESCSAAIAGIAASISVDGDAAGCMDQPEYDSDQAVWTWIDWKASNGPADDQDAAPGVMTALLERWPCGWRRRS